MPFTLDTLVRPINIIELVERCVAWFRDHLKDCRHPFRLLTSHFCYAKGRMYHLVVVQICFRSGRHCEMSSFGEKKATRFIKEDSASLVEYNRRQFSRIYPAGSRIDSSNFDPVQMWNVGCQLGNNSISNTQKVVMSADYLTTRIIT